MKNAVLLFLTLITGLIQAQNEKNPRKEILLGSKPADTIQGYISDYPFGMHDGFKIKTLSGDKLRIKPANLGEFEIDGIRWISLRDPDTKKMTFVMESKTQGAINLYLMPYQLVYRDVGFGSFAGQPGGTGFAPTYSHITGYGGEVRYYVTKKYVVYTLYKGNFKKALQKITADKPQILEKVNIRKADYEMIPEIIELYNSL